MKKTISIILLIFCAYSCKSQQLNTELVNESKLLMRKIFSDFEMINGVIVENKILSRVSASDINTWQQLVEKSHLKLTMALTYNAKTKEDRIDFTKIFTEEEIEYMSKQAAEIKTETWEDYLGIKPIKKHTSSVSTTYFLTIPVFTIKKNYALIYQEQSYGGSLVIYKKIDDTWQPIGNAMVWVS
tara:strand:+ start:4261 stop:4815 length:555 start_codon:yes stop_codon:yes gene_type:complete